MRSNLSCLGLVFVVAGCASAPVKSAIVNSETRATDAEIALDRAEKAMDALDPAEARTQLRTARELLSDPDIGYYPEHEAIQKRLASAEARLPKIVVARNSRELESAEGERQQRIDNAYYELRPALAALLTPDVTQDIIDRAKRAHDELQNALQAGKEFELRDPSFSRHTEKIYQSLLDSGPKIQLAEMRLVFSTTLTPMKHRARELQREAQALRDRKQKRARIEEAQKKLVQCASNARRLLEKNSALANTLVRVDGALTTPKSFIARCAVQEKSLQKRLRSSGNNNKA